MQEMMKRVVNNIIYDVTDLDRQIQPNKGYFG